MACDEELREARRAYGRIGGHQSWANTEDREARASRGQDGLLARFERQVDPHGVLSEVERQKRAESAHRAHMAALGAKSAKARKRT